MASYLLLLFSTKYLVLPKASDWPKPIIIKTRHLFTLHILFSLLFNANIQNYWHLLSKILKTNRVIKQLTFYWNNDHLTGQKGFISFNSDRHVFPSKRTKKSERYISSCVRCLLGASHQRCSKGQTMY